MHPPTMTAAAIPRPPWCLTPGAATYDNQPIYWVLECLTAASKVLSLATPKEKGTNGLVIGSLD
jgi:hypothetical protein